MKETETLFIFCYLGLSLSHGDSERAGQSGGQDTPRENISYEDSVQVGVHYIEQQSTVNNKVQYTTKHSTVHYTVQ